MRNDLYPRRDWLAQARQYAIKNERYMQQLRVNRMKRREHRQRMIAYWKRAVELGRERAKQRNKLFINKLRKREVTGKHTITSHRGWHPWYIQGLYDAR